MPKPQNHKNKFKIKNAYHKKRTPITCNCKDKETREKDRTKFGVCYCDAYSLHYKMGLVIANYLYQYLGDASQAIIREDWNIIEKHADAIKDYTNTDNWDKISKDLKVKKEFIKKEKDFKQAMKWIADNWNSLWW